MQPSLVMYRILRKLLQCLQVLVTDERLRGFIREQLYHDSVRTITEVLKDLNIDSKVYLLEEEDLQHIECPVIVHFKESERVSLRLKARHLEIAEI